MSWYQLHQSLETVVDGRFTEGCVHEAAGCAFAVVPPFVGEGHLDSTVHVTRRCLHSNGVRRDQLEADDKSSLIEVQVRTLECHV